MKTSNLLNKKQKVKNPLDDELKTQVLIEAKNLLKNSYKKERNKLDYKILDPDSPSGCIYGQMTGNCFSERAKTLIRKCTVKLLMGDGISDAIEKHKFVDENNRADNVYDNNYYWSPIEAFIFLPENKKNGNNKMLIDYLKGKRKTLKFKN